ncbi:hypothetical protein, partial [Pseudomonas lurida]|uniref:hypothetical protein n=1 Tax=Pseudomonas lurida TaxID=244566 RepID=UPI0034D95FBA
HQKLTTSLFLFYFTAIFPSQTQRFRLSDITLTAWLTCRTGMKHANYFAQTHHEPHNKKHFT